MKSEWKVYSVQELIDLDMLEEPMDGNHGGIHPKSSDYVSSGVPFIMANNLSNGKVDYDNCAFIQKMVKEPNAVTEPEWKAELSKIVLASDGVEKAHEWSSLYDGYSYEETEAKAQQCQKDCRRNLFYHFLHEFPSCFLSGE